MPSRRSRRQRAPRRSTQAVGPAPTSARGESTSLDAAAARAILWAVFRIISGRAPDSGLERLEFSKREHDHLQQQPAVAKARNLRFAIGSSRVADGNLGDLEVELRGPEDEIEITERVQLSEIGPIGGNFQVVLASERFRSAQRIGETLIEQP